MDFEDDVADDEENMEPEDGEEDEETKELHERIKREFIGGVGNDDDDLEEDEPEKLTGEGSQLKKTLRQFEQSDVYASDDEENPYASSVRPFINLSRFFWLIACMPRSSGGL
jgi:transcription initiation factor TFIIF subunit alpha